MAMTLPYQMPIACSSIVKLIGFHCSRTQAHVAKKRNTPFCLECLPFYLEHGLPVQRPTSNTCDLPKFASQHAVVPLLAFDVVRCNDLQHRNRRFLPVFCLVLDSLSFPSVSLHQGARIALPSFERGALCVRQHTEVGLQVFLKVLKTTGPSETPDTHLQNRRGHLQPSHHHLDQCGHPWLGDRVVSFHGAGCIYHPGVL